MFGIWKGFFASLCLVLSIQAVVAAADVNIVKEAESHGVKLSYAITSTAAVLNGPVVSASQASAVSVNLRKKEEVEVVDLEGVRVMQFVILNGMTK